jgi:RNA-binding protein YhbY
MEKVITMKARSAKNKGKRLQNILRDKLIELYPALKDDIGSQIMGVTGEDIVLTPHARALIPYSFECKNVEKLNVWKSFEQCKTNAGDLTPVLVIKKNRQTPKVVMELDEWLEIIRILGK